MAFCYKIPIELTRFDESFASLYTTPVPSASHVFNEFKISLSLATSNYRQPVQNLEKLVISVHCLHQLRRKFKSSFYEQIN
jgi:hypothetical protein